MPTKKVKLWHSISKGELINLAYDNDQNKIKNVDVALPFDYVHKSNISTFWFVMDYNQNTVFGEIRNLFDVAKENNIEFVM